MDKKAQVKAATPRLLERYRQEITPEMMKIFGYKNGLQVQDSGR